MSVPHRQIVRSPRGRPNFVGDAPPPAGDDGRRARAIAATLGPDFALTLAFLGTLATLVAAYGASFVWAKGPILVAGGILVSLVGVAFAYRLPGIWRGTTGAWRDFGAAAARVLRDWGPFTIIMWAFESMETYTGVIRKVGIDDALYRLDLRLFGVEPPSGSVASIIRC